MHQADGHHRLAQDPMQKSALPFLPLSFSCVQVSGVRNPLVLFISIIFWVLGLGLTFVGILFCGLGFLLCYPLPRDGEGEEAQSRAC